MIKRCLSISKRIQRNDKIASLSLSLDPKAKKKIYNFNGFALNESLKATPQKLFLFNIWSMEHAQNKKASTKTHQKRQKKKKAKDESVEKL